MEQLALMRREIDGLHRQLITFQIASGRPLPLHSNTPASDAAMDRLLDRLDDPSGSKERP